jgi:predicted nucleic acid-binding protein
LDVICLDANVLFSAAYDMAAGLRRLWELPDVELVAAGYALEECARNIHDPTQKAELARLLRSVRTLDHPASASCPDDVNLDEKDRPILLAAIHARASHLLTGDFRHFGHLYGKRIAGVLILTPAEYLRIRS